MTAPNHVAIIMDGNRRWATQRDGLPPLVGHRAGYLALKEMLKSTANLSGINVLTVYAFSTENFKRPKEEVDGIMDLALTLVLTDLAEIQSYGVRLKFLGDRKRLPQGLRKQMGIAEEQTASNSKLLFVVALSYGGTWDIMEGFKRLAQTLKSLEDDVQLSEDERLEYKSGQQEMFSNAPKVVNPEEITEDVINSLLPSGFLPPVDLLIRTGGEQRISNFLPWQLTYAEMYFTNVLWPDFTYNHFVESLQFYRTRQRRFGGSVTENKNVMSRSMYINSSLGYD